MVMANPFMPTQNPAALTPGVRDEATKRLNTKLCTRPLVAKTVRRVICTPRL